MLARQKKYIAEVFYLQHRSRVVREMYVFSALLIVSGLIAGYAITSTLEGGSTAFLGLSLGAFLLILIVSVISALESKRIRVVPYFTQKLGGSKTFLSGERILWNSKLLDEKSKELGVSLLSEFASGDDLVRGEQLCWFCAGKGLSTLERLTKVEVISAFPADVVVELTLMRDALRMASSQNVEFCLLLRSGSTASAQEMERRQGSFF